jgi:hypothetical protein
MVTGGEGAATARTLTTRADNLPLVAASTTQCPTVPTPSDRSSSSPGRMRRTLEAWKPSSPSTTTNSPGAGSAST